MSLVHRAKRPGLGFILLLFLCGALAWGYFLLSAGGAAGLYLERGGLGYLRIERGLFSGLKITDGYGEFARPTEGAYDFSSTPRFSRGRLVIRNVASFETGVEGMPRINFEYDFVLVPSKTVPGDWDLVAYVYRDDEEQKKQFNDDALPRLKDPIPSFLHRVDDKRVADYYFLRIADKSDDCLRLAHDFVKAHPDDPYFSTLKIDALLGKNDLNTVEKELNRLKALSGKSKDPFLAWIHDMTWQRTIEAERLSKEKANAYDFISELVSDKTSLAARLAKIDEIRKYHEYCIPMTSLIRDRMATNFLPMQVMAKVNNIEAVFMALQGRVAEAIDLLSDSERVAWMIGLNQDEMSRVISVGCRAIPLVGLKTIALNACHTEAEIARLWQALEGMEKREAPAQARIASPLCPLSIEDGKAHYAGLPENYDATVRGQIVETRFLENKVITAVRAHQLKTGSLPQSAAELAPRMPSLPGDPFTSASMCSLSNPDAFVVYSVGPDKQDDRALIEYDPSNGTVSAGDISVRIPREREIPFPAGGVHAASAAEFRRLFPNGLPTDPFADTKGRTLGVTSTTPVIVYSFGPDANQADADEQGEKYVPSVAYDPTNGTTSDGDLFLKIPE